MQITDKKPILVTDSGVGGLTVLNKLSLAFPNQSFIYYSDYKNVPYGSKSKTEIERFCIERIDYALKSNVKLMVVACNTMSVVGKKIFAKSKIPIVNVVAFDEIKGDFFSEPIVMFCTPQTAKSLPISRLSRIKVIALPDLANDIEKHIFDLNYVPDCLKKDYGNFNTVVLGCTHYLFLKSDFAARCNTNNIIDGTEDIAERVARFIGEPPDNENKLKRARVRFVGSGAKRTHAVYKLRFLKP